MGYLQIYPATYGLEESLCGARCSYFISPFFVNGHETFEMNSKEPICEWRRFAWLFENFKTATVLQIPSKSSSVQASEKGRVCAITELD